MAAITAPLNSTNVRNTPRFDIPTARGRIAAWRLGAARDPVVLLSHDRAGHGSQLQAFGQAAVQARYQAVLFDHLGHGESDAGQASLGAFAFGLERVARHLEAQGLRVAGVVGHGLGAAAVAPWLNDVPRALRAVLLAPSAVAPSRGVQAEALVIHDVSDRDAQFETGLELARAWAGARFLATRGLGHGAMLRDPAVVRDAIDYLTGAVVFAPPPAPGETRPFRAPAPLF